MGLKKCLYCAEEISEYAVTCPKCKTYKPLDKQNKQENEEKLKLEEERKIETEQALNESILCKECGNPIRISEIIKSKGKVGCKKCGFPDITIKCVLCNNPAIMYDSGQKAFTCEDHFTVSCDDCGKKVLQKDIIHRGIGGGCNMPSSHYYYCRSCARKYPDLRNGGCLGIFLLMIAVGYSLSFVK